TQCPTFDGSACTAPIANCNDVITCLSCLDLHAVQRSLTQEVGSANSTAFGTSSTTNRCQRMIGKATSKYDGSVAKVMNKCWDARLRGQHSNACPVPGDGKASAALAKAEQKKVATICKSCGGADHACNGTGDIAVGDIGFPATCPSVTVPGGDACAGAVSTLSQLVACVDCVAEFEARCADAVAVPGLIALPAQCGGVPPTTTTSGPTTTTSTTLPASNFLDFTTGLAGGTCGNTFSDVSGTTVIKNLTCGGLSLGGGKSTVPEGPTPDGSTSRFNADCTGNTCTLGAFSV